MKLKASALISSIYVCLILAVICSVLLYIFHFENFLFQKYEDNYTLISEHESATTYFLSKGYNSDKQIEESIVDSKYLSECKWRKWGVFNLMEIKSYAGNDTLSKVFLVGLSGENDKSSVLYLSDNARLLRLGNDSRLIGDLRIPKGRFNTSNYEGQSFQKGLIMVSEKKLPEIEINQDSIINGFNNAKFGKLARAGISNSFQKNPLIIKISGGVLSGMKLLGNIIIESDENLIIGADMILENVILKAPKVVFKSGFRGNCQVFATELIKAEDNTFFEYPTIFSGFSERDSLKIEINEYSKLDGAVVLQSTNTNDNFKDQIILEKNVQINGTIYCQGDLNLKGNVYGHVYTERLFDQNEKTLAVEINVLEDCTLDNRDFPEYFFQLIKQKESEYVIIKQL